MAFLKGLSPEQMEVRVMGESEYGFFPAPSFRDWERDMHKHLQTDLKVDSIHSDYLSDPGS